MICKLTEVICKLTEVLLVRKVMLVKPVSERGEGGRNGGGGRGEKKREKKMDFLWTLVEFFTLFAAKNH